MTAARVPTDGAAPDKDASKLFGYRLSVGFRTTKQRDNALAFLVATDLPALLTFGDATWPFRQTLGNGFELGEPYPRVGPGRLLGICGSWLSQAAWAGLAFAAARLKGARPKLYFGVYPNTTQIHTVSEAPTDERNVRVDSRGLYLPPPLPDAMAKIFQHQLLHRQAEREAIEAWVTKADATLAAQHTRPSRKARLT